MWLINPGKFLIPEECTYLTLPLRSLVWQRNYPYRVVPPELFCSREIKWMKRIGNIWERNLLTNETTGMRLINGYCWTLTLWVLFSCCEEKTNRSAKVLSGDYWKSQALNDIIPNWTKFAQDKESGTFYTTLDSLWQPTGDQNKYPSMISRHLFSYSVSYLLSGNEDYLVIADSTVKWLLNQAWDKEFGGWFDSVDGKGNPVQTTKTTFVQVYAITGLVMYYFVTHDKTVLRYIEKSNELLEQKVWDKVAGGYYNTMNRDWTILDSNKDFASQMTPVSGYLLYLYQATKEKKYLDQTKRILDVTTYNMTDNDSGWILESYDCNWRYLAGKAVESEINVGHNIEVAWMLLRSYLLTGDKDQLEAAKKISSKIESSFVFNNHNIWLTSTSRYSINQGSRTYWWVQAYGNMFKQYLYRIFKDDQYIDAFQRGGEFWDSGFLDKRHGDTFYSVDSTGSNKDAHKADRYKTSYHSMEQCLINYLSLSSWTNNEPTKLYFRINLSVEGELLFPVILEDESLKISKVVIENIDKTSLVNSSQSITLPALCNSRIIIEIINPNKF